MCVTKSGTSAVKLSIGSTTGCTITFKTLLRHYDKWALTPRLVDVKLGRRRNYHDGRAAIRHYANQPARPNFTSTYRGVNARLA